MNLYLNGRRHKRLSCLPIIGLLLIGLQSMAIAQSSSPVPANPKNLRLLGDTSPDTTSPLCEILSPQNNATVSQNLSVSVTASDNRAVASVDLFVDGVKKTTTTTVPYQFAIDTRLLTNGNHQLLAKAYDLAGNIGSSVTVSVVVSNPAVHLVPAQVLNLTNWKETIPLGAAEKPTEIMQPQLATYEIDPYFIVDPEKSAVRFQAPTNAVTTSGSNYPRSELREMTSNGATLASWSTSSGTHTMMIDQAITQVPIVKKHVVAGQIHDANDDVIVIRLEYPKLFVDINGVTGPTLDSNYQLGRRFTVKFVASGGQVKIYYNNASTPAYTLSRSVSGCYFKAGVYTQSNCTKEGAACGSNNLGEVLIYDLMVTHQ